MQRLVVGETKASIVLGLPFFRELFPDAFRTVTSVVLPEAKMLHFYGGGDVKSQAQAACHQIC